MAMPKSVTRYSKSKGLRFTSNVDRVNYTMEQLTKRALKDVAKFLRSKVRQNIPKDSGATRRNLGTWVRKDWKTGDLVLHIGIYNTARSRKKGYPPVFHHHILEFGSSKMSAVNNGRGFLKSTTKDNIDEIVKIESKYLSELEKDIQQMSEEKEEISDD